MYIRLSSGLNVKVIPFYPVACLGHVISNGRRMAVTRQRFEVRSVYFHLLFHCHYFPYLV